MPVRAQGPTLQGHIGDGGNKPLAGAALRRMSLTSGLRGALQSFKELVQEIEDLLAEVKSSGDSGKKDKLLKDADEALGDAQIEADSMTSADNKRAALEKIKELKLRMRTAKRARLAGTDDGKAGAEASVSGVEQSRQGLAKLEGARQMLLETEDVGAKVLSDLTVQKETLKRTTAKMKETNGELSLANKLANKMSRWWR